MIGNIIALCFSLTHTDTDTHPSLPLLLTSVVHLGHYRRREGERENERKQKEEERGKGVSVYKAYPPPSPSLPLSTRSFYPLFYTSLSPFQTWTGLKA